MLFKFRNEINVLNHYIFISLLLPLKTIIEVKCLAKKYAVNSVVIIPIPKVIANPFTGPDPKANNIIAAINVVIFASNAVILALE